MRTYFVAIVLSERARTHRLEKGRVVHVVVVRAQPRTSVHSSHARPHGWELWRRPRKRRGATKRRGARLGRRGAGEACSRGPPAGRWRRPRRRRPWVRQWRRVDLGGWQGQEKGGKQGRAGQRGGRPKGRAPRNGTHPQPPEFQVRSWAFGWPLRLTSCWSAWPHTRPTRPPAVRTPSVRSFSLRTCTCAAMSGSCTSVYIRRRASNPVDGPSPRRGEARWREPDGRWRALYLQEAFQCFGWRGRCCAAAPASCSGCAQSPRTGAGAPGR